MRLAGSVAIMAESRAIDSAEAGGQKVGVWSSFWATTSQGVEPSNGGRPASA